jgi:LPXTG-motif cell wall-anchored protein
MEMKFLKTIFAVFTFALLGATLAFGARADTWNKKTVVTFNQPVEIPGRVLPAGTYTFKLLDSPSDRHIVQIFNEDGTQLITTILAINDYRLQPKGDTVMKFNERPGDSPEALRAWFYPGDNFGQEFVYPKVRAIQLAQTEKIAVPAVAVETLDDDSIKTAPIIAITPDQKEVEVVTAIETTPPAAVETPAPVADTTPAPVADATPAPAEAAPAAQAQELPHTASNMPLIALLGGLSISLALGLVFILKRAS